MSGDLLYADDSTEETAVTLVYTDLEEEALANGYELKVEYLNGADVYLLTGTKQTPAGPLVVSRRVPGALVDNSCLPVAVAVLRVVLNDMTMAFALHKRKLGECDG